MRYRTQEECMEMNYDGRCEQFDSCEECCQDIEEAEMDYGQSKGGVE